MMKRWSAFFFSCLPLLLVAQAGEIQFFVAPNGKAENRGTLERPFATTEQARDAIRKARLHGEARAATVFFREGEYYMENSLVLDERDGGTSEHPLRYAAYKREKVIFHGSKRLSPSTFKTLNSGAIYERLQPEMRGKILAVDLKKAGIADFGAMKQHGFGLVAEPAPLELFIDGERQPLARYPNEGFLPIGRVYDPGSVPRNGDFSNRGARFGYEYDRPARWQKAKDIWLHGRFSFGFNDDHLLVAAIDTSEKSIRLAQPHLYGVVSSLYPDSSKWSDMAGLSLRGYYAYNLPEEIDRPGEWYLDRTTGMLYLYPPEGFEQARFEVSMLEAPMIEARNAAYLSFEGITFCASRGMGIYLENAHDIDIDACDFYALGTVAVSTGQPLRHSRQGYAADGAPLLDDWVSHDFQRIRIRNCRIYNTGAGGVILSGGDRRTLSASGNEVSHCEFYRVDRRHHTYAPAVKLFGTGAVVQHCYFHDLLHMAVGFRGNDHAILCNRFERVCTYADDMGAIYTGRDPASQGTVIRYNHFVDIVPADNEVQVGGIFLDDGACGMEVGHNFFERVGSKGDKELFGAVFMHGGHGNLVHHNVFLDCEMAVGNNYWRDEVWKSFLEKPLIRQRLLEEVDITSAVYREKYPGLRDFFTDPGPRLNKIAENYLIDSQLAINGKLELFFNHLEKRGYLEQALEKCGYTEPETGPENR
ncbi:MAG: right-handed parallel beta-helix repeat-containing protein [Lewinellaceae bacterium]|nr:right-handed parallel beta-helix repeat-containing protein [Lewinellaceae bacterium]